MCEQTAPQGATDGCARHSLKVGSCLACAKQVTLYNGWLGIQFDGWTWNKMIKYKRNNRVHTCQRFSVSCTERFFFCFQFL